MMVYWVIPMRGNALRYKLTFFLKERPLQPLLMLIPASDLFLLGDPGCSSGDPTPGRRLETAAVAAVEGLGAGHSAWWGPGRGRGGRRELARRSAPSGEEIPARRRAPKRRRRNRQRTVKETRREPWPAHI